MVLSFTCLFEVILFGNLIDLFFITFIIQLLISLYSIYTLIDIKIFHNMQGSKLTLKKSIQNNGGDFK